MATMHNNPAWMDKIATYFGYRPAFHGAALETWRRKMLKDALVNLRIIPNEPGMPPLHEMLETLHKFSKNEWIVVETRLVEINKP